MWDQSDFSPPTGWRRGGEREVAMLEVVDPGSRQVRRLSDNARMVEQKGPFRPILPHPPERLVAEDHVDIRGPGVQGAVFPRVRNRLRGEPRPNEENSFPGPPLPGAENPLVLAGERVDDREGVFPMYLARPAERSSQGKAGAVRRRFLERQASHAVRQFCPIRQGSPPQGQPQFEPLPDAGAQEDPDERLRLPTSRTGRRDDDQDLRPPGRCQSLRFLLGHASSLPVDSAYSIKHYRFLLSPAPQSQTRSARPTGLPFGSETPDIATYEEMLREAAEEVLWPIRTDSSLLCPDLSHGLFP